MSVERAVISVTAFGELVDRIAQFESFTIAGRVYSADLLIPQLTIDAKDLMSEAQSAGAFALTWGLEAVRARRFHAKVSASYRTWRSRTWLETKATPAEGTGKFPTDTQCTNIYRMSPEYGAWRSRLDDAQESAEMAEAIYEAFKVKKEMIKSSQEIMRTEAGGSPYSVVENPRSTVPRQAREI